MDRLFVLSYPYFISPRFRERLSEKVKNTPTDENEAEVEADCLYNHFLNRKNQIVSPEQSNIKPMANRKPYFQCSSGMIEKFMP